jgi:hypothetical protein
MAGWNKKKSTSSLKWFGHVFHVSATNTFWNDNENWWTRILCNKPQPKWDFKLYNPDIDHNRAKKNTLHLEENDFFMILHTVFFLVFIHCRQIFITADINQLLQSFIYSSLGFSISAVPVWIQNSEWWHWAQAGHTVNIKKTLIVFIFNKMYIKTGSCQYLVNLLTVLLLLVQRAVAVPPMSQIMDNNKWGRKMDLWCVKFSPKNIRNISNLSCSS